MADPQTGRIVTVRLGDELTGFGPASPGPGTAGYGREQAPCAALIEHNNERLAAIRLDIVRAYDGAFTGKDALPDLARTYALLVEHEFQTVAEELTQAYLKMITIDGHFHADPHPGNIFVVLPEHENPMTPSEVVARERRETPRPAVTPLARIEEQARQAAAPQPVDIDVKLAVIDFGMTARLSTTMREGIVRLLLSISDNRGDDAAATTIELGDPLPTFDRTAYTRETASLIARNYDLAVGEVEAGKILYELINSAYQHGLRLPAELALLAKALFNLDAITRSLDPSFSPIVTIRQIANQLAAERVRRDLSPRRLFQLVTEGGELLNALPHRLDLITERMSANEFQIRMDVPQTHALLDGMRKLANRIFSGLVLAGLIIASAMLLPYRRALGTAGFWIAGAIGLYMVVSIWIKDRRER
jgi:ubiquinone biosynthesis protein